MIWWDWKKPRPSGLHWKGSGGVELLVREEVLGR